MRKKLTCFVLAACIMLTCFVTGSISYSAAETEKTSASAGSTEPLRKIQGSAILHCFDWSYTSIKNNMKAIKDAGYTAVQTSPVQPAKDYSASYRDQSGQWWKLYQPLGIRISEGNQTWLGSKAELKAMCDEADRYGIKVVVDVVANHVANKSDGGGAWNVNDGVDSELKRNDYYHGEDYGAGDGDRYSMTHGHIGMPDLNTAHSDIQNKFKNFLIDCVNQGVDGFRFDAAKHIELPEDGGNTGSQFWPTILNGAKSKKSDVYFYGEILNDAAGSESNYTKYMSITDNKAGDKILKSVCDGNAQGAANSYCFKNGVSVDKTVLWCESHDTYMGNSGSAEGMSNTKNVPSDKIVRAWGMIGSRANASSLFFARPAANMGDASSDTTWKSKTVAEVNKFKNYFDGEGEYLSSQGDVAYNERGTTGVVISKMNGSGQVSLPAHKMKDGTYKDAVSGGTFTVSGGKINGSVGSSGVAVVYNAAPAGPSVSIDYNGSNQGGSFFGTAKITLSAANTKTQTYTLGSGAETSYTNGQTITIGSNMADDQSVTLVLKGVASDGKTVTANYVFTKKKQPSISGNTTVYYDNSSTKWPTVWVYAYQGDGAVSNGAWPGKPMTQVSDTLWGYDIDDSWADVTTRVIFSNNGSDQSTKDGNDINKNESKIYQNGDWKDYPKQSNPSTQPASQTPATVAPVPSGSGLYGDVNNDGRVVVSDASAIQKHAAGIATLSALNQAKGDVDSDGRVTVKDATCIQWYIAKVTARAGRAGKTYGSSNPVTPTQAPATAAPTQPPTQAPSGKTVYFNNDVNWSNVNVYYWKDGEEGPNPWPGVPMEKQSDGRYKYVIPEGYDKVIFNNGSSGGNNQTRDIDVENNKEYNYNSYPS